MSNGRRDTDYLDDMEHGIKKVITHLEGLDKEQFLRDEWTQDAVVRNIEIIGQAAKELSESTREMCPEVDWKKLMGMRDRLAHGYFAINLDVVWNTVQEDLPHLLVQVQGLKKQLSADETERQERPTPSRVPPQRNKGQDYER